MNYQANTAKTYLKGKEVGKFIKQNYGKELLSYTNKDLLKELDEKYNVSVNYNTLRKEAGRIRSTNKFFDRSLETVLSEGITPKNIPLDRLISLYEKNPKRAEKEFSKAKIKGARRTRYQIANSLNMTMKQFQDYIYSDAKKIMKTLIDKDELLSYITEFEQHINNNNLILAYTLNRKMHELVDEKISGLHIEKGEEIIYYENLEEINKEFEKDKNQISENDEFVRKDNIEFLKSFIENAKILYNYNEMSKIKIYELDKRFYNVKDEKFSVAIKNDRELRKKLKEESAEGLSTIIFTDGKRAFRGSPDVNGRIREDYTVMGLHKMPGKDKITFDTENAGELIYLVEDFIPEIILQISFNYAGDLAVAAINIHSANVATGNPNMDYPNLKGLVQNLAEEQDKYEIKRFFSNLGLKFN